MRVFITVLVLIFSFQSWTKGDDIRDFEIEGISIGESALNYTSKKNLKENKKNWFKGNEYSISANLGLSFLKIYDGLQFIYFTNDQKYKLEGIEAIKFYADDIQSCLSLFDEVSLELQTLFSNISVTEKRDYKHRGDELGKTIVTQQDLTFPSGDAVSIFCEDWSKETGYTDALRISIRKKNYKDFLAYKAY